MSHRNWLSFSIRYNASAEMSERQGIFCSSRVRAVKSNKGFCNGLLNETEETRVNTRPSAKKDQQCEIRQIILLHFAPPLKIKIQYCFKAIFPHSQNSAPE